MTEAGVWRKRMLWCVLLPWVTKRMFWGRGRRGLVHLAYKYVEWKDQKSKFHCSQFLYNEVECLFQGSPTLVKAKENRLSS
jgi:hypothetical protein